MHGTREGLMKFGGAALVFLVALVLAVPAASFARSTGTPQGRLAFVRGGDIWTAGVDGGGQRRLTSSAASDFQPAWSPNGRRIAFLRGSRKLLIMDADGDHLRRIAFPIGLKQMPGTARKRVVYTLSALTWLPNGRDLVVAAHAFSDYPNMASGMNETQLFLVRPNGSRQRRVGPLIYGHPERVSCRPDGARIALSLYYRMGYSSVRILNRATGRYANVFSKHYLDYAAWSPNGRSLACERNDDQTYIQGPAHLVAMNVKTRAVTDLLAVDDGLEWPYLYACWSPGGAWLACSIGEHEGSYPDYSSPVRSIEVMTASGGDSHEVLYDADEPAWCPSASR
jgi:Tol biopolymer transport system component